MTQDDITELVLAHLRSHPDDYLRYLKRVAQLVHMGFTVYQLCTYLRMQFRYVTGRLYQKADFLVIAEALVADVHDMTISGLLQMPDDDEEEDNDDGAPLA